ncbi:uncharacterized protein Dana_GF11144, isoform C [Drosophila ananassae]|uniref:Uncharacterized protein, isoform C n=1 Tax=Drosophila ananassae TaxID=7217 RepID=A0A0P8ZRW1_DROAN|nr:uncharacterized protein LOC6494009 isoform X5 [Drosophila ananassae]KPU77183.1 uncharacterized protein Dana_GF11144, isoform C [Drosophila ananassae]
MDLFILYVGCFIIFFLIMPIVYFVMQFLLFALLNVCCGTNHRAFENPSPGRRQRRRQPRSQLVGIDRQGNVFTVPEERSHNRYGDIFFIEPGSEEANRIREQLEKDEKELPSYDEVMRMCNLTTPTSAAAPLPQSALPEPLGPIGIPALPAPPYSETDPHLDASGATVIAMEPVQPSTSRAAQILPTAAPPATPSPATQTTV